MGPIGFKELLIILVIALLVFGGKKLKSLGSDLGGAVKGFKKAMNDGDTDESAKQLKHMEGDAEFDAEHKSTAEAGKSAAK
jgi:sec-independent protein translocase protein TatA